MWERGTRNFRWHYDTDGTLVGMKVGVSDGTAVGVEGFAVGWKVGAPGITVGLNSCWGDSW